MRKGRKGSGSLPSAFSLQPLAFSLQHSAFSIQPSSLLSVLSRLLRDKLCETNASLSYLPAFIPLLNSIAPAKQLAFKIERGSGPGDVFDVGCFNSGAIQLKAAKIGAEIKRAAGAEGLQALVDQLYMVALDIQKVFHALAVAEGGWVHPFGV